MAISQSWRQGAMMLLQILIVAALFALVLLLAERHNRRFDLSPTQQYSLSDASKNVARDLKLPVRITAFYNSQEEAQRREMQDTFDLFVKASPNITYRLVDLDRSPALAQKYGVSNVNSGVLEADGKVRELRLVDEEEITNGLLKLTRQRERKLCFVTGNGEHNPFDTNDRYGYSDLGKALEKENYVIAELSSIPPTGIPKDCTVVVLAGPSKEFLPGESDDLGRHLDGGGQVLFLIDPGAPASAEAFLARYGVRAGKDVVLDERNRLMGTDSSMLNVPAFNKAVFRTDLETAVFPVARTILPIEEAEGENKLVALALSSPDSWAYVNGGALPDGEVRFRRDVDQPGPFPVGILVKLHGDNAANDTATNGRLIVYGDSDFASNLSLNWRGNKDVMMSSLALLAEDSTLIAVRRKGPPGGSISPIYLSESEDNVVKWVSVVTVPAIFAAVGIVLTARRRKRASR
jgi:ABC-type uncharacterized transport system involved in gliding motility auxiliary subunit